MVYRARAMKHLKKISRIIYLKVSLSVLEKRIGMVQRGIIGAKKKSFQEIYNERMPLYEKYADFTIENEDAGKIISEILRALSLDEK